MFIDYNFAFVLILLVIYLIDLATGTDFVSYGESHRLKSFYVEGGPYGLYISTLIFIELISFKRALTLAVFSIVLLFSKSKAGYVFTILGLCYLVFSNTKQLKLFVDPHHKLRFIFILILFISIGLGSTLLVGKNYIYSITNISQEIKERPRDTSLAMGRIASLFIGYNIIRNNPLLGVGMGNYSLVRNNITYRDKLPAVNEWDLPGWGGIFNIPIENGIVGLCFFVTTVLCFFTFESKNIPYLILFIIPILLGAQLYMVYPWVYLGFYRLREESMLPFSPRIPVTTGAAIESHPPC